MYVHIILIYLSRIVIRSINFTTPTIEYEYLTTLFDRAEDNGENDVLFMKASEILKIIQFASGGRSLSTYKLNITLNPNSDRI